MGVHRVLLPLVLGGFACSGDQSSGTTTHDLAANQPSDPSNGGSSVSGSGKSWGGDDSGVLGSLSTEGGSGEPGAIDACASSEALAVVRPLNLIVALDRSGSMDDGVKWPAATNALSAFLSDPASGGLGVALKFFPEGDCDDPACSIEACADPSLNLGLLSSEPADAHEVALLDLIENTDPKPWGKTPMFVALSGVEAWAEDYLKQHPDELAAVILVTDGEPKGCTEDIDMIAEVALGAFGHGVRTYAVGLYGAFEAHINQIAVAGGTNAGFFLDEGQNTEAGLLSALEAIRVASIACEIPIPVPDSGTIDPEAVDVAFSSGTMPGKNLVKVESESECANGDWYYDDPSAPNSIILCPSTCGSIQADSAAHLQFVFGCKTTVE